MQALPSIASHLERGDATLEAQLDRTVTSAATDETPLVATEVV